MSDHRSRFLQLALNADALRFGQFTLKSGRVSPYFFNAGRFDTGLALAQLGNCYADAVESSGVAFDQLFGPAYKGIPLAVATTIALAGRGVVKPYLFDRKERKTHGEEASAKADAASLLVGHRPGSGARLALVDDVLTTGATKFEAVTLLRALVEGARFPALVIALDRQETGPDGRDACGAFQADTGIPVAPVVTMTEVLSHLRATGRLPDADHARCRAYLAEFGTPPARAWAAS